MQVKKPKHVAIIMDGNGRWAKLHGKPRIFGHKRGAKIIDEIVKSALQQKIKILSLFAFSCENWKRPKAEVNYIMKLVWNKLNKKTIDSFNKNGIQFRWIGFNDKISKKLINKLLLVQSATVKNRQMILNFCYNYGGLQDILQAADEFKNSSNRQFIKLLLTKNLPPVDLLIRTGNEKRISNFMLFQLAYSEIIFEPTYWPEYNSKIFIKNLLEFSNRERRFGKI